MIVDQRIQWAPQCADRQIQPILSEPENITKEESLDILFHEEELEDLRAQLSSATNQIAIENTWKTEGIYCIAHTSQLMVKDGSKKLD